MEQERRQVYSFEQAATTFLMHLELMPELLDEFHALSGGSIGLNEALMVTIADEISYTPMEEITPQRIRTIVGAPSDPEQLYEWRGQFWEQYKAARTQRTD